jgi:hypothetical protein
MILIIDHADSGYFKLVCRAQDLLGKVIHSHPYQAGVFEYCPGVPPV